MSECALITITPDAMNHVTLILALLGVAVIGHLIATAIERTLVWIGLLRRYRITINLNTNSIAAIAETTEEPRA